MVDDVTNKLCKMIAQINCTNQLHQSIAQDWMTSQPGMEIMDDAFGFSRTTQLCTEDLRLVNLTEFHPWYAYE